MLGSPRAPLLHNRLLYLNSVLRAERSAAALRFARSTVGQICKALQSETMGDTGFEHVQESSGNSDVFKTGGAECGADAPGWHIPVAQDDPDLKKLSEGWSALPVEIRAGIMLIASSCKSS